jgi:hypothetical protein
LDGNVTMADMFASARFLAMASRAFRMQAGSSAVMRMHPRFRIRSMATLWVAWIALIVLPPFPITAGKPYTTTTIRKGSNVV